MTRPELLAVAKPILFNTEMIRAILDGRKTVTRRVVKPKYSNTHLQMFTNKYGTRLVELQNNIEGETYGKNADGTGWQKLLAMRETEYDHKPYKKGDILYVRETFAEVETCTGRPFIIYKSDDNGAHADDNHKFTGWRPSIHMPKEAARLFLRVTDVRVERLQDITEEQAKKEGINENSRSFKEWQAGWCRSAYIMSFSELWNSTIKKPDLNKYGWNANPFVWVYEFERIETDE